MNRPPPVPLPGPGPRPDSGPDNDSRPSGEAGLVDQYRRRARDLRVSLTDRCNLRCTYCMPEQGLDWLPQRHLLDAGEIVRLIDIAVRLLGVREVRFTGGEPLLRGDLVEIVAATARLTPRPGLSLTTNGIGLERVAHALRDAGLDRLNVSLDTLDAQRFATLTRRARLADVLAGLAAAADAGLHPIKVNSVLVRGVNDDEALALLRYCLANGYEQRFIEAMPLDGGHAWTREKLVPAREILDAVRAEFNLLPDPAHRGGAPAQTWLIDGYPGTPKIGIIASITEPFCAACERTRLTADGQVRACLFSHEETDLRSAIRAGATDEEIAALWRVAMWGKQAGHGINDPGFGQPARPMSAIGG